MNNTSVSGERRPNIKRPSKDDYYLDIAKAVAARATCMRRKFGAIIVKDDTIVSTGYNGSARGVINCTESGCLKDEVNAPHYSAYEFCPAVHAEENVVINAARNGGSVLGGTLFIHGEYPNGGLSAAMPCDRCKRAIINAGIETVVIRKSDGSVERVKTSDWIRDDSWSYMLQLQEARMKKSQKTAQDVF